MVPDGEVLHEGDAAALGGVEDDDRRLALSLLGGVRAESTAAMSLPGMEMTFQPKAAQRVSWLSWRMTSSVEPEICRRLRSRNTHRLLRP